MLVSVWTVSRLLGGDLDALFDGDDIAVYIVNGKSGEAFAYNQERIDRRFTACSTFKIPNALIALDSGLVSSTEQVFPYDPERHKHPHRRSAEYNRDQTLDTAFQFSVVWTFQEIAKSVGVEGYETYLERFDYGNKDTSGGVDAFWLGSLKISAREQVRFLREFYQNAFNLRENAIQTVKEIMLLEENEAYRLYGKTGTKLPEDGRWLGWMVGFVEMEEDVFHFAINLDSESYEKLTSERKAILKRCLQFLKKVSSPSK